MMKIPECTYQFIMSTYPNMRRIDIIPDAIETWFAQANWTWSRSDLHASFMENLTAANADYLYPDYIWYVDHGKDLDDERVRLDLYEQATGVEKGKPNATRWSLCGR